MHVLFQPSWRRGLLAAVLAAGAFLVPQEAPLAYYPLNNPSNVYYLEITCQASAEGTTRIFYDLGNGFNDLNSITIPIGPSSQPFTYTFPLPDAPIVALRIDPLDKPGELLITNFRIYDRRGREFRRFTRESVVRTREIADVAPATDGWKLVTTADAKNSSALFEMPAPLLPEGMSERNLERCLLSWSYLTLMLGIILLAVHFVVAWKPPNTDGNANNADAGPKAFGWWAHSVPSWCFIAFIAMLFSAVGNRGLIKDSVRYAWYVPPPLETRTRLDIELEGDQATIAQLFWDTGRGFNEAQSVRQDFQPPPRRQILRFQLPREVPLRALRFDPLSSAGRLDVFSIRLVDQYLKVRRIVPLSSLRAVRDIQNLETRDQKLVIQTTADARDPILEFAPDEVAAITAATAANGAGAKDR